MIKLLFFTGKMSNILVKKDVLMTIQELYYEMFTLWKTCYQHEPFFCSL